MFPGCKAYRLYERGGVGICCDELGVALGPVVLVAKAEEGARKRYYICSAETLAKALITAYGGLPGDVMVRLAYGIRRVAESLEAGDLALAKIKALQLKFPEIEPENLAKMAACDLAKFNPWHDLLGRFTDAMHAVGDAIVGAAHAGERPKRSMGGKKFRHIGKLPGGLHGTVIKFKNDNRLGASPDQPISAKTAKMVEDVVGKSGLKSVTINSTTGGAHSPLSRHYAGEAVDIDMIDGYSVRDPRIRDKVLRLQQAFQNHPNIHENFGPALQLRRELNGVVVKKPEMLKGHAGHIHISGQR